MGRFRPPVRTGPLRRCCLGLLGLRLVLGLGRRRTKVDSKGEDPVVDRRGGVAEHGEVEEVELGLLDELLAFGAFHGRKPAAAHGLGALAEPFDHRLDIELIAHAESVGCRLVTVALTGDLDRARADLAEHGYCLLEGVLPEPRLSATRERLASIARDEVEAGTDYVYENGSNQRVWTLLNKGDEFVELALDPTVGRLMKELLGPIYLLSNLDANIAGPGGQPMFLHADQSFVPPPWPDFPLVANAMWMLDDFTPDNGATRVVPGTHLHGHGPTGGQVEAVPVCGPAGSVMVFDGRLWHQTGANVTEEARRHGILAYYCRPFMRTQENWFLSIDPAVLEREPRLRGLLGYEIYLSLGMVDGMPRNAPRF